MHLVSSRKTFSLLLPNGPWGAAQALQGKRELEHCLLQPQSALGAAPFISSKGHQHHELQRD